MLKWNGTTWVPGNDNTGGGGGTISILPGVAIDVIDNGNNNFTISNAGDINPFDDITTSSMAGGDLSGPFTNLQINPFAVTNAELSNNSVFTNNLIDGSVTGDKIAQQGAGIDQVLKWNGTTWAPGSPGDNWGTQTPQQTTPLLETALALTHWALPNKVLPTVRYSSGTVIPGRQQMTSTPVTTGVHKRQTLTLPLP